MARSNAGFPDIGLTLSYADPKIHRMFLRTLAFATLLWWNCGLAPVSAQKPAGDYFAYVGSYTHPTPSTVSDSKGIYGFRFDSKSGALTAIGLVAETVNPAHLWASPNGRFLYAVNWQTGDQTNGDTVSAFSIDQKTGHLTFLNKVSAHGDWANQVVLDPSGKVAITVTYQTGTVSALPIEPDGRLGEAFYTDQHAGPSAGHGPPGPHAHEVIFSQDGQLRLRDGPGVGSHLQLSPRCGQAGDHSMRSRVS